MNKTERLAEIRNIIKCNKIGSQDELLEILNGKGFSYTQATLSRDLKYLRVGKIPDNDRGMVYVLLDKSIQGITTTDELHSTDVGQHTGFISVEYTSNSNMAVIKTLPGFAGSLAYRIDGLNAYEIIGTIAGDDTVLVIGREGISRSALVKSLKPVIS